MFGICQTRRWKPLIPAPPEKQKENKDGGKKKKESARVCRGRRGSFKSIPLRSDGIPRSASRAGYYIQIFDFTGALGATSMRGSAIPSSISVLRPRVPHHHSPHEGGRAGAGVKQWPPPPPHQTARRRRESAGELQCGSECDCASKQMLK